MQKYSHNYSVILDNMDLIEYRLKPISAIMYIQDAFARYCATKNMAAYHLFPKNLYWIVSEFNIEFTDNLPFWSEEIRAEIWTSELTKLRLYTDFRLYYKEREVAKGYCCWFIIDQASKRPVKTDFIADRIQVCNELTLGEHKKFSLSEMQDKVCDIVHKNNLTDIDFNKHVNNKSYLNIAEATATDEFRKTHSLKTLNIKYIRESFLNDELVCSAYRTAEPKTFVHRITKDGEAICEIQTSWIEKDIKEHILGYDLAVERE